MHNYLINLFLELTQFEIPQPAFTYTDVAIAGMVDVSHPLHILSTRSEILLVQILSKSLACHVISSMKCICIL